MINMQHVTKRFGDRTVLHDISFHVEKGEIVAFLGPNGAGKTTTMRILTCFMPPTEGLVQVAGFDGVDHPLEVKKRVGYLPETPPLYLELTVQEYLTFVGRLKRMDSHYISQRMASLIDQLELGEVRSRLIGHLSRGFRQRVGLAQALLHDPPILILDEPTVGLDPKQILEIRQLIQNLTGSHTIILSTHILSEATAVCQRVIIIHQGRIVAIDTPDHLAARFQQSETVSLTVKHPPADWETQLLQLAGVLSVEKGPTPRTFLVTCALGTDLREALAARATRDAGLLELKTVSLSLEEVFLQLTEQEPGPSAEPAIGLEGRKDQPSSCPPSPH